MVGLILLMLLTLLAAAGMSTATMELVMAGNEQYHERASQAAAAGIEHALGRIGMAGASPDRAPVFVSDEPVAEESADTYSTSTRYVGEERGLPQSSVDKFVGLHFEIQSIGRSARDAQDVQVQGVLVVAPLGSPGSEALEPIGTGLER